MKIKLAQDFDFNLPALPGEPAQSSAPTSSGPSRPSSQNNQSARNQSSSAFSAVKSMQQAILQFAENASDDYATHMLNPNQKENRPLGNNGEYKGGSDPFGTFLSHHIQEERGAGQQYPNADLSTKERAGSGIEDANLRGIIDSIRRIGSPGKDTVPDGVWKSRTDNALSQISKLMKTICDLAKSMNVQIEGLDQTVETFTGFLPKQYTEIKEEEKSALAEELTKLIEQLTKLFSAFKSSILDNKDLAPYITQEKSFAQYSKASAGGREGLSQEEQATFDGASSQNVPGLTLAKKPVSLINLSSKENFGQLLQQAGINPKDPRQVQNALSVLSQQLGGAASSFAPDDPNQMVPDGAAPVSAPGYQNNREPYSSVPGVDVSPIAPNKTLGY